MEGIMPRNTSVTLGEHFEHFIAQKIAQGRYQSASEAIRAGLRRLEEDEIKLELLRDKLEGAEQSPVVDNFRCEDFLKKMRQKHL
jgi:antitoxin ParD1/3/4